MSDLDEDVGLDVLILEQKQEKLEERVKKLEQVVGLLSDPDQLTIGNRKTLFGQIRDLWDRLEGLRS